MAASLSAFRNASSALSCAGDIPVDLEDRIAICGERLAACDNNMASSACDLGQIAMPFSVSGEYIVRVSSDRANQRVKRLQNLVHILTENFLATPAVE